VRWFWQQYLGDRLGDPPPHTDMLKADLRGLPPLLLTAAECDPLFDETPALAARLRAATVPHEVVVWPGMIHGCIGMSRMLNAADAQLAGVGVWLTRALGQE
jgi:acetyl esterase